MTEPGQTSAPEPIDPLADEDTQTVAPQEEQAAAKPVQPDGDEVVEPPTVREFFGVPEKPADKGDDLWQAFQERLAEETRGIKWTAAMPELGSKIAELLDIRVHDILLTAWKKVEAVRQALEESKQTPDKATYLDLAEHSVDYETNPFIDVKLKKVSVKRVTLNVAMNLKIKGFGLKIQNGLIRELQAGKCEGKGTIKFQKLSIAEKKLEPIKFPLSIKIPNLIPIAEEVKGKSPEKPITAKPTAADSEKPLERIEL